MLKKVVILAVLIFNLNATVLIDTYRQKGIDAVIKEMEKVLQTPSYWQNYISDKDVTYGYYENDPTLVIVDKSKKKLKVHRHYQGKRNLKLTQEVIVGKMGAKEKEGDLKTPVGVYEVRRRFRPSDQFYGPVAFALSYPNLMDKLQGKNGHGIWIHGYPVDGSSRDERTKGCVVMTNDLLGKFDITVGMDKAITIISEKGEPKTNKNSISQLLAQLYQWRYAWKESDVNKYLSFYHNDFRRFDGMNFKNFKRMKKIIFKRNEEKMIQFKDIKITPYPNENEQNLYRISFYERYKTKRYKFDGHKELYVELKNKQMKILAEK